MSYRQLQQLNMPTQMASIRKDFPLLRKMVYLNSAAVCVSPLPVIRSIDEFQQNKNMVNPERLHDWLSITERARKAIASFIGAKPHEIAFTMNTEDGLNLVANGLRSIREGDRVIAHNIDFSSTHVVWRTCARRRKVRYQVFSHRKGAVSTDMWEDALCGKRGERKARMISVAMVSHVNGYLNEMQSLCDMAHAHGAYVCVDAVQAVGSVPVNVKKLGIDFMTCATYKWLLGSIGLGFVYIREELLPEVFPQSFGWLQETHFPGKRSYDRIKDARKFEYGSLPFQGIYELEQSLGYRKQIGFAKTSAYAIALGLYTQEQLRANGFRLFTPQGNRSPVVTFYVKDGIGISRALLRENISVMGRTDSIRVAPNFYNTPAEVDTFIHTLCRLTERDRA